MASTDCLPVPKKNTAFRVIFPIRDNDGDLVTGAAGLDSEISKDQGTAADCTNEATEIATATGLYYLDLTSAEMNADNVAIIVKTSTVNAKTAVIVLYPQEAGDIQVNATYWNGTAVAAPNTAGVPLVDIGRINNSTVAAVRQGLIALAATPATVDNTAFTATATIFECDDITEATANHFVGRSVYPTSGALLGVCLGVVTAYALTSGRGRFTVSPGSPTGEAMADNVTLLLI